MKEGIPNGPRHPGRESAEEYRDSVLGKNDTRESQQGVIQARGDLGSRTKLTIEDICRKVGGGIQ